MSENKWNEVDLIADNYVLARAQRRKYTHLRDKLYEKLYERTRGLIRRLVYGSITVSTLSGRRKFSLNSLHTMTDIEECIQDLTQEGFAQAFSRFQKFDRTRGTFSQFIIPEIVLHVVRYAETAYPLIHVSKDSYEQVRDEQNNKPHIRQAREAIRANFGVLSLDDEETFEEHKRYQNGRTEDDLIKSIDISNGIATLPPEIARVIHLRSGRGMMFKEIGKKSTMHYFWKRGLDTLRERITDYGPES